MIRPLSSRACERIMRSIGLHCVNPLEHVLIDERRGYAEARGIRIGKLLIRVTHWRWVGFNGEVLDRPHWMFSIWWGLRDIVIWRVGP